MRWNDDGTVDLMLGPDYDNAVITATQEELGTLFGPDEKPFEGTNITVLTLDSGPKGGISGPINAFRPVWEELSGGKLDIALTPITDLYAKMMLDLRQGTGLYDAHHRRRVLLRRSGRGRVHGAGRRLHGERRVPAVVVRRDAEVAVDPASLGRRRLRRAQ